MGNTRPILILAAAITLIDIHASNLAAGTPSATGKETLSRDSGTPIAITSLVAWDSRYVLEGRDMLAGQGLSSFTFEADYAGFLIGAWIANSEGADYQEQNYFAEYGFDLFGLEAYLSYMHLQFQSDGIDDNEIGAGLSAPDALFGLTPAVDWYYSFDAGGSFYEFSLRKECAISERLTLAPSLIFGLNDGYIGDGHRGANHVAIQLAAIYEISERIALEAYVAQTLAIDSNPATFGGDAALNDFFYGGVALSVSF